MDNVLRGRSSLFGAMLWMLCLSFLLTLLLSWVPFVGPFIGPILGGYVGGKRAGGPGRALLAAILPAVLVFAIFLALGAAGAVFSGIPLVGPLLALLGGAAGFLAVGHNAALVVAALVGGLAAHSDY